MLEEGSFRGRKADFVFMFLFGGVLMTVSFCTLSILGLRDTFLPVVTQTRRDSTQSLAAMCLGAPARSRVPEQHNREIEGCLVHYRGSETWMQRARRKEQARERMGPGHLETTQSGPHIQVHNRAGV